MLGFNSSSTPSTATAIDLGSLQVSAFPYTLSVLHPPTVLTQTHQNNPRTMSKRRHGICHWCGKRARKHSSNRTRPLLSAIKILWVSWERSERKVVAASTLGAAAEEDANCLGCIGCRRLSRQSRICGSRP